MTQYGVLGKANVANLAKIALETFDCGAHNEDVGKIF